jgi:hypothetical protein
VILMARAAITDQRVRLLSAPTSPPSQNADSDPMVSLREMKTRAEALDPRHPFRVLIMGEPDEIPRHEYVTKVVGWFRLIATSADSAPLGGR